MTSRRAIRSACPARPMPPTPWPLSAAVACWASTSGRAREPVRLPRRGSADGGQGRGRRRRRARRLRPPPDGDRADARGGARDVSGSAGVGRLRAADLPPDGGMLDRFADVWPRPTRSSSPTSGPAATRTRRSPARRPWPTPSAPARPLGSAARRHRVGRADRRLPGRQGRARATWCWSWAAAGRTSSPTGSWRCSAAAPSGQPSRLWAMPQLTPGDGQDLLAASRGLGAGATRTDPGPLRGRRRVPRATRSTRAAQGRQCHPRATGTGWPPTQANVEFDAERVWVSGATVLASWHAAYTRRTPA